MLIVMSIEDGRIIREPVATEDEPRALLPDIPPLFRLQPRLQEVSLSPRAVCPPPYPLLSAGIGVSLSTLDD